MHLYLLYLSFLFKMAFLGGEKQKRERAYWSQHRLGTAQNNDYFFLLKLFLYIF
jgi:hypothetical protein